MGHVGILIFIDEDVFEPALILGQHIRVRLKNRHHMQQQITEVGGVQLNQTALILRVNLRPTVVIGPGIRTWNLIGGQGAVLPAVDDPRQHPRGPAFVVDPLCGDQLLKQTQLVIRIEDREIAFQPHQFSMAPQQLDADRVERAKPRHPLHLLAQHLTHAVLHLARGLVGKGDRQNLMRPCAPGVEQMHDSRRQRPRFTSACPGKHQHRAVQCLDRRTLGGVQPLQIRLRARSHGAGGQGSALKGVHFVKITHAHNLARPRYEIKRRSTNVPSKDY